MMSDDSVYDADSDEYKKIANDLKKQDITVKRNRKRDTYEVKSRLFDGKDWLDEEEDTVFDRIPIVPVYGNFDIIENKKIYFGVIEKLYDQQRSLNYAISRDIEDGALAPSPTVWMTKAMGQGNDYSKMNIDRRGVRFFNPDPDAPGLTPQYTGGPQVSVGLQTTIQNMMQMVNATANVFNAQQGNAMASQSGIAGMQQIDQGNLGANKWFKDLEVAICQIGKVLVGAIPKVYDSTRQIRVLEEDGTSKFVTLNNNILDAESGKNVEINDLSKGIYDVVCEVGPAFNSQQKATADKFLEMAQVDPTIIQSNKDVFLKNQKTPGMDIAAERARAELFNAGMIPEKQWTDEEKQQVQAQQAAAQNQPPQEDPMMVAAQAEMQKAQADMIAAQNKSQQIQGDIQIKQQDQQIRMMELQLKQQEFDRQANAKYNTDAARIQQDGAKIEQEQQKINLSAQSQEFTQMLEMQKQAIAELTAEVNAMKTVKETANIGNEQPVINSVIEDY